MRCAPDLASDLVHSRKQRSSTLSAATFRRSKLTNPAAASSPAIYCCCCALAEAGTRLTEFRHRKSAARRIQPLISPCKRYLRIKPPPPLASTLPTQPPPKTTSSPVPTHT